jgi:hypothetical protein
VIEGLQPHGQDGALIAAKYTSEGKPTFAAASTGRVDLVGRVIWGKATEENLRKFDATKVYVNSFQQMPAELEPVAGNDRERRFRVPILLNQPKGNRVEVVLPEGLVNSRDNPNSFEIDCAKPEGGQRLHALIIAPNEQDEQKLWERVQRGLHLRLSPEGEIERPVFQNFRMQAVLTGYRVTEQTVHTQLYLIREQIKRQKNSDLRPNVKPLNDVVVVYFQGGESITPAEHLLSTRPTSEEARGARRGVTVEYLRKTLGDMPAASLLLLDTTRSTSPALAKGGQVQDEVMQWPEWARVGVIRTAWGARTAAPPEARLIPALESALTRERLLGEVLKYLSKEYETVSKKYPTVFEFNAQAARLMDLVVGVRP